MSSHKKCSGCKEILPLEAFNKNASSKDGRFHYCRQCNAKRRSEHRANRPEHYRTKTRKAVAKWRENQLSENPKELRKASAIATSKSYFKHREEVIIRQSLKQRNNPQKLKARVAVYLAIKKGLLSRPKNCPECGREGHIIGHHDDYNKPLEVKWVCKVCHDLIHKET